MDRLLGSIATLTLRCLRGAGRAPRCSRGGSSPWLGITLIGGCWALPQSCRADFLTTDYAKHDFRVGGTTWKPSGIYDAADEYVEASGDPHTILICRAYLDPLTATGLALGGVRLVGANSRVQAWCQEALLSGVGM